VCVCVVIECVCVECVCVVIECVSVRIFLMNCDESLWIV